eukprot:3938800-Rhodomonas_salina.1
MGNRATSYVGSYDVFGVGNFGLYLLWVDPFSSSLGGGGGEPGERATYVSASGGVVCAVSSSGRLRCWGSVSGGSIPWASSSSGGDAGAVSLYDSVVYPGFFGVGGSPRGSSVYSVVVSSGRTCVVFSSGGGVGVVECFPAGHGANPPFGSLSVSAGGAWNSSVWGGVEEEDWRGCVDAYNQSAAAAWFSSRLSSSGVGSRSGCASPPRDRATMGVFGVWGEAGVVGGGWSGVCFLTPVSRVFCYESGRVDGLFGGGWYGVLPSTAVRQLSVGRSHACALTESGEVRCWGYNGAGRLGFSGDSIYYDGGSSSSSSSSAAGYLLESRVPVVSGLAPDRVLQVSCGVRHTCVLLSSLGRGGVGVGVSGVGGSSVGGRVKCWGSNALGQTGSSFLGTLASASSNVFVWGEETAVGVFAGEDMSCVLLVGHVEVWCWGFVGVDGG